MIHICSKCGTKRDCGCGDCGEKVEELCTPCNNKIVLKEAKEREIPISELGMDPLGGYHIKKLKEILKE